MPTLAGLFAAQEVDMPDEKRKYPKEYWMGVGLSIGVAIGVALAPLFDNIGIGIAIGIAIGSGIGASLQQKNKDNVGPLTEHEKARQKRGVIAGLILASLAFIGVLILVLLQGR